MPRKENEYFAKRVVHYLNNMAKGDAKNTGKTEYAPIPGRPISKQMLKTQKKNETLFTKCPATSVRIVAKKLDIPKSTISDIKVKKLGFRAQTQKKAPKYVKDQERRAKTGLRKIYKKTLRKTLVIDDETYVVLEPEGQPGHKYVHSKNHDELPFQFKFKRFTKFPKK
ncbi:hypothetical protein ILUMI_12393 [Ignelater luminosus]|uniref:Uncharacterized protein n=1 Tax=Ignelater luminosus TaxID=2038154 RepID=A0A8K0D0E9_IGNLU|nr:hypothetical protein ILUMI_12393 [Ignelater luminosus]